MNKASIMNSRRAAEWLSGKAFSSDVTIEIQPQRQTIAGRSWELMLALGMCSLLTGTPLQPTVTGTGTVGKDGMILEVSSYPEKIWASMEAGHTKFLLPDGMFKERQRFAQLDIIPIRSLNEAWMIAAEQPEGLLDM